MDGRNVLERVLAGDQNPTNLPLALLQNITENFSKERKIGEGGFGKVYMVRSFFSFFKKKYISSRFRSPRR